MQTQATSIPTFVCNLDASAARSVCEAHDYLCDVRRELVSCVNRSGFWPGDRARLDRIDSSLKRVDAVILGEVTPDSVFGHVPPVLWAIYAVKVH